MSPHNSYDDVEYSSLPIREADPLVMATIANLHGVETVDPADCDYLELGCGDGGNLLSLATAYPGIRAVGFDPAVVAIERGQGVVERTGLQNLALHHDEGAVDLDASADYVVAHGVLSWVHEEPRKAVIAAAARAARPGALVNFSYRALPYAYYELAARDAAHFAIQVETERAAARGEVLSAQDETRIARERVQLAVASSGNMFPHHPAMQMMANKWAATEDWTLYHDDLSDPMQPFRMTEIAELAAEHGLRYVGELIPQDMWQHRVDENFGARVRELAGPDAVRRRQLVDDLTGAGFHSSLFVKSDTPAGLEPDLGDRAFHVRQWAYDVEKGDVRSDAISAPVAQVIREHRPAPVLSTAIAEELGRDQAVVDVDLLKLYSLELVRLSSYPPPVEAEAGEFPRTTPFIVDQIRTGSEFLTSRFHNAVGYEKSARRAVFLLTDGTRDRAAILRDLPAVAAAEGLTDLLDDVLADLDSMLADAAVSGMFLPPDQD